MSLLGLRLGSNCDSWSGFGHQMTNLLGIGTDLFGIRWDSLGNNACNDVPNINVVRHARGFALRGKRRAAVSTHSYPR